MGLAYVPDYSVSAFACMAAPDGDITDYLRLPHILKRKNSFRPEEKMMKVRTVTKISDGILLFSQFIGSRFTSIKELHLYQKTSRCYNRWGIEGSLDDC